MLFMGFEQGRRLRLQGLATIAEVGRVYEMVETSHEAEATEQDCPDMLL
jgi:hypothetical protein